MGILPDMAVYENAALNGEIDRLKAELAATEVQRDAAVAALENLVDCVAYTPRQDSARLAAIQALSLTPERAASVIEERDRLREAAVRIRDIKPDSQAYAMWINVFEKCQLIARQALAAPPEPTPAAEPEPVLITRIAYPETNAVLPVDDPDASTGMPFRDVPPGRVFRTMTGFRGTKWASYRCVSYQDGRDTWIDEDTECWLIPLGGCHPAEVTP